jgi:hypothetical protein
MSSRSRLLLALTASAFLIGAAPAMAKGIAAASVCGADGCTMVAHAKTRDGSCRSCSAEELLSIRETAYPATRAPYVRIVLTLGAGGTAVGTERLLYSPSLKLAARRSDLSGDWTWYHPPAAAVAIVTRMIGDIRPYGAAGMPLGVAAPTAVTSSPQDSGPADAGRSPLLAGFAILAVALCAGGVLASRRRRNGRRALGPT